MYLTRKRKREFRQYKLNIKMWAIIFTLRAAALSRTLAKHQLLTQRIHLIFAGWERTYRLSGPWRKLQLRKSLAFDLPRRCTENICMNWKGFRKFFTGLGWKELRR